LAFSSAVASRLSPVRPGRSRSHRASPADRRAWPGCDPNQFHRRCLRRLLLPLAETRLQGQAPVRRGAARSLSVPRRERPRSGRLGLAAFGAR
jgi:hypothetical protein